MTFRKLLAAASLAVSALVANPASATVSFDLSISGDTFMKPFLATNSSTAGETVVGFGITLAAPLFFDTAAGGEGVGQYKALQTLNAAATGLTGSSVLDGGNSLAFTFGDFDPTETFRWVIDVDGLNEMRILGDQLVGSTAYVDFSDGQRLLGVFESDGASGSKAVFSPAVPEPATWMMLIVAFAAVGFQMRRVKKSFAAAF